MKKVLLPEFDRAFAGLIADLNQRGMLDSTLVISMGEFGRTPKVNSAAGRDHHNDCWSIAIAGAGIPGGRILGATDKYAAEVTDLPVAPEDLLCTICHILGIDPTHEYDTPLRRPVKVNNGGRIVPEILGGMG